MCFVFCASILFLCTDSLHSCLLFVSSVWALLPEIKRWNEMHGMELAMVSQCTKFEVSRFARYDAMNGGAKCRKWGSLGQLSASAMSPFDRAHTTSYSTLIETMRLSCTVLEI